MTQYILIDSVFSECRESPKDTFTFRSHLNIRAGKYSLLCAVCPIYQFKKKLQDFSDYHDIAERSKLYWPNSVA